MIWFAQRTSVWDLHKVWLKAKLDIITDAGHSITDPEILEALIKATDRYAK